MGLVLALVVGAAIGGAARLTLLRYVPRRTDVAIILASVGAALGILAKVMTTGTWNAVFDASPGIAIAGAIGAAVILLAFHLLPRIAPSLIESLPGRDDRPVH